ncbi:C-type lectin protein [Flammula alnicola]|nr:C-type lectin protein [Flammula alnicola]
MSTDPVQASHHHLFSLSAVRSIISTPITEQCTLHILERPSFMYKPLSYTIAHSLAPSVDGSAGNIPTLEEWKTLWANWDLITLQMIPSEMLHQKPIDLRHKCLFYIGHIPTFLDMLISKSIGGEATEPKYFWNIFERGIDPHVDDPDHCHNHSEVPEKDEDWPTIESIMGFRDGVRARLAQLYDDLATGKLALTRNIARMLVMTHEHEAFHVETLLYMLIQKAGCGGTLPPPGFIVPPWEDLARQWAAIPPPSTPTVLVGPATLAMGHDDSEGDDLTAASEPVLDVVGRTFGWDNESPARTIKVGAFKAEWRPVTNGEFERFCRGAGKDLVQMPKSWVQEAGGDVKVRTMYGFVPMHIAEHWPVLTSYDDLALYAKFKGGRLPTEPELRLFLDLYDVGHEGGANVGFRNWHPVPATMGLEAYGGKGSNGGVWEWTSTVFDTHDGLVPTKLFTGYSADFFDTKHQVSLGASYATIPRLAGRRTVRNFYQHNYPYPWIGARVVYDV